MELVAATGDQLMGIGLVPHIPDQPIVGSGKYIMQSQGQLDNTETGAEMAAAGSHLIDDNLADLSGKLFQLGHRKTANIFRRIDLVKGDDLLFNRGILQ
jgi:hypothetical protein